MFSRIRTEANGRVLGAGGVAFGAYYNRQPVLPPPVRCCTSAPVTYEQCYVEPVVLNNNASSANGGIGIPPVSHWLTGQRSSADTGVVLPSPLLIAIWNRFLCSQSPR